jgi:hypothetical protein
MRNVCKSAKILGQARSHTLEEELCKESRNSHSSDALHPYNLICQQTKENLLCRNPLHVLALSVHLQEALH